MLQEMFSRGGSKNIRDQILKSFSPFTDIFQLGSVSAGFT